MSSGFSFPPGFVVLEDTHPARKALVAALEHISEEFESARLTLRRLTLRWSTKATLPEWSNEPVLLPGIGEPEGLEWKPPLGCLSIALSYLLEKPEVPAREERESAQGRLTVTGSWWGIECLALVTYRDIGALPYAQTIPDLDVHLAVDAAAAGLDVPDATTMPTGVGVNTDEVAVMLAHHREEMAHLKRLMAAHNAIYMVLGQYQDQVLTLLGVLRTLQTLACKHGESDGEVAELYLAVAEQLKAPGASSSNQS